MCRKYRAARALSALYSPRPGLRAVVPPLRCPLCTTFGPFAVRLASRRKRGQRRGDRQAGDSLAEFWFVVFHFSRAKLHGVKSFIRPARLNILLLRLSIYLSIYLSILLRFAKRSLTCMQALTYLLLTNFWSLAFETVPREKKNWPAAALGL